MTKTINTVVITSWLLISTAWIKLLFYNQIPVELQLAEMGISWHLAQPLARVLCILASVGWFVSPVLQKRKMIIGGLSGLLLVAFTQFVFGHPSHATYNDGFIYPVFKISILRYSLFFLALMLLFAVSKRIKNFGWVNKNRSYLILVLSSACAAILFWIRPIYIEDFQKTAVALPVDTEMQYKRIAGKVDEAKPAYLFYFSLGCEHCYLMYHRLAASAVAKKPNYQAQLVFSGPKEGLKDFIGQTKIPFPATQVLGKQFYYESGPEVPAIYKFQNVKCTGYWLGDGFNFYMLNYLGQQ